MKHSPFFKIGLFMTLFLIFSYCTNEEDFGNDIEKAYVRSFFDVEALQSSRSVDFTDKLTLLVVNTLCKQENLIDAIRTYKKQYGTPMWKHSVGIATENGYQLFVPIHNENSKDEINFIWNFKIYNNRLYHFTTKRPLNSNIVAEYWKFDYFTIYALGKKPKSGLSFEHVESRTTSECVHASITVGEGEYEHTENKGWHCWQTDDSVPDDGDTGSGSGGDGFPSDIPVEGDGGSGGGGNSGSSSPGGDNNDNTSDSGVAPKAQAIFRNSNMTEQNWNVIENMLEKIIENCMGQNLYNGLVEKLNGSTLSIQFVNTDYSSFHFVNGTSGIKLSSQNVESNHLIHEMFHAFQAYQETESSYVNAQMNLEIEAHYAQYIYLKNLPEFPGSDWSSNYAMDERHKQIAILELYILPNGQLHSYMTEDDLDKRMAEVVDTFRTYSEYSALVYNTDRKGENNFKNLKTLTINCSL